MGVVDDDVGSSAALTTSPTNSMVIVLQFTTLYYKRSRYISGCFTELDTYHISNGRGSISFLLEFCVALLQFHVRLAELGWSTVLLSSHVWVQMTPIRAKRKRQSPSFKNWRRRLKARHSAMVVGVSHGRYRSLGLGVYGKIIFWSYGVRYQSTVQ